MRPLRRERMYNRAMDEILLHVCCGPCSTVAVPHWRAEGLEPSALFLNPNVQPAAEHVRRVAAMEQYADAAGLRLIVDEGLGAGAWGAATGAWAKPDAPVAAPSDPAGRCHACLELRLRETAWAAAERGVPRFSTSLSVSPWQRHDLIAGLGYAVAEEAGVEFLYADLRPHYRQSIEASRRLGLYRQRYCGCVPSKWEAWSERLRRRRERRAEAA